MSIRVFVQNEAGSRTKNSHDEKTLAFRGSRIVSHAYPFPYGFIVGTAAKDGCNVDCFVITTRMLKTGDVMECEPVALTEQFEDGVEDHNVLVRLIDEESEITHAVKQALTEHVLTCFRHVDGKQVSVGRFRGPDDAHAHIASHLDLEPNDLGTSPEAQSSVLSERRSED